MAILMQAELPGVTTDQYDTLNAKLQALPSSPFDGCLAHVCVPTGGGLQITDLWESEQAMRNFMEIVMPLAAEANLPQGPEPTISKVHNHWIPPGA
ncbi:hypothetical protein A8W25_27845 [Streptomyces sp. ERV7]|uniref:hypothetical protein n=1 Tax=Streptomyces sp. ERV7 TaxID=1322334 RepID=UPI0007F4DF72|nr:hypothetical protein [Streptomyces sp. ERV7]OAR23305.1 hypothetical protein A8W25_27845 [Streptomyces sp. ERV7]